MNASKGNALSFLSSYLGFRCEDVIAFGDSLNDLSMIQAAGRGVLMKNGRTELRTLSDDICESNQEDGVAEYLKLVFREVL